MKISLPSAYRFIRSLLWHHRSFFGLVVLLGLLTQATSLLAPYVSRKLIDNVYLNQDPSLIRTLIATSIALVISTIVWRNAQLFCSQELRARLQLDLTDRMYEQVLGQSMDFFYFHGPGDISSRFQTLRASLGILVAGFQTISSNIAFLLLIPPILFSINVTLALITVSIIPAAAYLSFKQCSSAHRRVQNLVEQTAQNDEFQTSTFVGIRSLKGLNSEEYCRATFQARNARSTRLQQKKNYAQARYSIGISALRTASLALCTLFGWHFVFIKSITLGQYIAFVAYINYLYSPLQTVVEALSSIQEAAVSLELPLQFLSKPRETQNWQTRFSAPSPIQMPISEIRLQEIRFGYSGDKIIFEQLNTTFCKGTTAIIGQSGCGKTTLLQLLSGLHSPYGGVIKFDDVNIRHVPLAEIRAQVSVVWQESWVFPGTLWENLVMNQNVSKHEVERIVEVCRMKDIIAALPDGYETKLGAGGIVLSAGQRQLLSIARALIRKTPILLLDEATANIDLASESQLLESLLHECRDRITIITTHRAAPAMLTDVVFACRRGHLEDITTQLRAPLPFSRNGAGSNDTDERVRALLHDHADVFENHAASGA